MSVLRWQQQTFAVPTLWNVDFRFSLEAIYAARHSMNAAGNSYYRAVNLKIAREQRVP
jgi:hypothetical protein